REFHYRSVPPSGVSSPELLWGTKKKGRRVSAPPCDFNARLSPSLRSEHLLLPQLLDVAAAQVEPAGEHFVGVLAELRRRLQLGRLAVEANRPGFADPVAIGVMHRLHDAALLEALVLLQLQRVMDGPGRHPGGADDLHRLDL